MKKIDKTPEWQENIGVSRAVRNCLAVAITTVSVLIAGCATSGGDPLSASAADVAKSTLDTMPVTLSFDGQFAGEPFSCDGQYLNTGLTDVPVTVSEYKLYVSRVRMLTSDGVEVPVVLTPDGLWQQEDVALLDFEDGQGNCSNGTSPTNTRVTGTVPAGEYTGLAFDIGVPFEKNHVDPTLAASPLNLTSMFWNWRGGYRFMRVDMASSDAVSSTHEQLQKPTAQMDASKHAKNVAASMTPAMKKGGAHGAGRGWSLHVGSTGCKADSPTMAPSSCDSPNRIQISLPDFNADENTLVIDPAAVLQQVDVTRNTPETPPGCMSSPTDPECETILPLLGLKGADSAQRLVSVR